MKLPRAFYSFRFLQRLSLLFLSTFLTAAAYAQTVNYYKFTPPIIPSTTTQNVLLEVRVSGVPTRVALDFDPAGTQPLLDLRDDGTNGDRRAGDSIYSILLTPAQVLQGLRSDDVFRRFVGFLRLFQGNTLSASFNILTEIYTPDLSTVVVQSLASDMQATDSVVNIYDPGYFSATSNGVDLYRISRRIYQQFGDVYDMLNLVTSANYIDNRHHVSIRNNVQGIGMTILDNGAGTGSGARLLGFDVFPSSVFFDGADIGYSHEFGHQWIQYMHVVPFESGIPHWPISSLASGVMGFSIPPTAEGGNYNCRLVSEAGGVRLQPDNNPKTFTDFDLYMMGLLQKDQVGEHIIFDNQSDPTIRQCNGQLYTGPVTRVHTSDVVTAFGERVPDVANSPKAFRVATVVISPDGLLSPEAMTFYSFFARRAEATQALTTHIGLVKHMDNPFAVATGNRASLTTAWVTIAPGSLPDAAFARPYSQTLSQSGLLGAPIWSINAGALPPGLTLDAASGVLSGIPTTTGSFNFTVRVTSNNYFIEHDYSVHVGFRPVITAVSPSPNIVRNLITYSVTVKPSVVGLPNPTGTVQFKLHGNAIGNAVPLVDGAASLTLTAPPTGVYQVSVSYSGDSNYLAGNATANTPLAIFQFSVRDDRLGNYILFNATTAPSLPAGAFYLNNCAPWVPPPAPARLGIGVILSAAACTITLDHHRTAMISNSFRVVLNTCTNQGVMTSRTGLVLLHDSNTTDNSSFCR